MSVRFFQAVVFITGVAGLWLLLSSLVGIVALIPRRVSPAMRRLNESQSEREAEANWPLAARIARSLGRLSPQISSVEALEVRLLKAGLPYVSAPHYYSRQLTFTILFGCFGLLLGVAPSLGGWSLPPTLVLGLSLGLAIWGSLQPAMEVAHQLEARSRNLVVDMTYNLPRLLIHLKARGNIQAAFDAYAMLERRQTRSPEELEAAKAELDSAAQQYALELGHTLEGFGGNLFADLVNRLALYLSQGSGVDEAVSKARQFYPYSVELDQFLNSIVGGLTRQFPLEQRLDDLSQQLRNDLRQRQREAGSKARQIVMVSSAFILIPIFLIFGGPLFSFLTTFFR